MSWAKCFVCGKGMAEGVSLFRQNEKGVEPIMACREHNQKPIDPQVNSIVTTIEREQVK